MLVDKITIKGEAGKGGDGVVRWRREKYIDKGGPWGGDGGRGGDLYFKAIRDVYALRRYDNNKAYQAHDGKAGGGRLCEGLAGEDIILEIPVGSIVYSREYDLTTRFDEEGEVRLMLRGGKGGYGNNHFKSSTNQTPLESTPGGRGESATFDIEVEMIAKAGLIGLPNAGKSSLLNELTRAHAKTANYAFTTLEPNLGDFHGFVIADLPGLIEGAAEGKGLGHKFLKHVRRTETLVHLVSAENEDVAKEYKGIRKELAAFDATLSDKPEILVLSKIDTAAEKDILKKQKELAKASGKEVILLSLYDDASVKNFSEVLRKELEK